MDCRTAVENMDVFLVVPLSILANSLALYIVAKRSTNELASYRVVLLATCVFDLVNSAYSLLLDVHMEVVHGVVLWFVVGPMHHLLKLLPASFEFYTLALYISLQIVVLNVAAIPFLYRYLLVCRNVKPSNRIIALLYFILVVSALAYVPLRAYLTEKYSPFLHDRVSMDQVYCKSRNFTTGYRSENIEKGVDRLLNLSTGAFSAFSYAGFLVLLLCGSAIIRFVRRNKHVLKNPKKEMEITKTLTILMLIPSLVIGVPTLVGRVLAIAMPPYANLSIVVYTYPFRAWIWFFNPLLTIYFIREYRAAFLGFFRARNYVESSDARPSA